MTPPESATHLYIAATDGVATDPANTSSGALAAFHDLAPGLEDLAERSDFCAGSTLTRPRPSPCLRIIAAGLLVLTDEDSALCVTVADQGSPIPSRATSGVWLSGGSILEIPAARVVEGYGASVALAVLERAAALAQAAAQSELVCVVRHTATRRLSRWLSQIFRQTDTVTLSQADLARLTGLQRTSVCQAMATIQGDGAVKVARGKITLRDAGVLSRLACDCGGRACASEPRLLTG